MSQFVAIGDTPTQKPCHHRCGDFKFVLGNSPRVIPIIPHCVLTVYSHPMNANMELARGCTKRRTGPWGRAVADVTGPRGSRASIRASKIRGRRLFEATRDGILILAPNTPFWIPITKG